LAMTSGLSSVDEVVPRLRPIIIEWKMTPNSRIRKVVICWVNETVGVVLLSVPASWSFWVRDS
jgi:hypothetical protein